jgi:glycosyltransferase involved in cell wall biosynthesis
MHLSLSHGGGVITAMEAFISNSVFAEHYLVADIDQTCSIEFSENVNLNKIFQIKLGLTGLLDIYKAFKEIRPTHIHLHSSHAGAIGRILFPFFKNIIYTPHCYAFERKDISNAKLKLIYLTEWILAAIPSTIAGCSPREKELADKLGNNKIFKKKQNVFLTNYAPNSLQRWHQDAKNAKTVVMIGRLCPQKDVDFYIETFLQCRKTEPTIKFQWIGAGDQELTDKLDKVGITCTGWLAREQILDQVTNSSLYFHCAAWEGNPMSLLEVASVAAPIICRETDAISSLEIKGHSTTTHCAEAILSFFNNENHSAHIVYKSLNKLCSKQSQIAALKELYTIEK